MKFLNFYNPLLNNGNFSAVLLKFVFKNKKGESKNFSMSVTPMSI